MVRKLNRREGVKMMQRRRRRRQGQQQFYNEKQEGGGKMVKKNGLNCIQEWSSVLLYEFVNCQLPTHATRNTEFLPCNPPFSFIYIRIERQLGGFSAWCACVVQRPYLKVLQLFTSTTTATTTTTTTITTKSTTTTTRHEPRTWRCRYICHNERQWAKQPKN